MRLNVLSMKLLLPTLASLLIGVATITTVNAQVFTSGTFSTDSVLTLAGSPADELYGVAFGNSIHSTTDTSNGYSFFEDPGLGGTAPVTYDPGHVAAASGFMGTATTGDANFNAVLNGAEVPAGGTLTLNGLSSDTTYNLLLMDDDNRTGITGNRTFSITANSLTSPTQQYEFDSQDASGSPNIGGYIMDTFTTGAGQTSETVVVNNGDGNQLNAILLETDNTAEVPEPSSSSLILMGIALMVVVLRQRGAARQT
jgi:hypothetical protein